MKRLKKVFLFIALCFVGYVFFFQLYYILKNEGNVIVYLTDQSSSDSLSIELFLDGEKKITNNTMNEFIFFKKYTFNENIANHTFKIKINNDLSEEVKVNTFFVTWIIIEYFPNSESPFLIDVRKCPLTIIN